MDRRDFLTRGLTLSGVALGGVAGLFPRRIWASGGGNDFSIDVVTDRPDRAIRGIERVLQGSPLGQQVVRYSEHRLTGSHVGDIAFVKGRKLVNFHRANDDISRRLRQAAAALSLPRRLDDPVWLRFCAEGHALTPTEAQVFRGDALVERLPLERATDAHRIDGAQGHIEVAVENGAVSIVSASCRHKTCMGMGAISRAGQRLVCIPNQIVVAIAGTDGLGVDGVTF